MSKTISILISVFLLMLFLRADIPKNDGKSAAAAAVVDTAIASKLFVQGDRFSQMARFDSAIVCFAQAASIYQSAQQFGKYAGCKVKISEQYIMAGALDQARVYAIEASKSSLKHSNMEELGGSYNCIGTIYCYKGQIDSGMAQFRKAVSVWRDNKVSNQSGLAEVLANMGSINMALGNYEEALSNTSQAISITQSLKGNYDASLSTYDNNLGALYHKKGKYNQAAKYFKRSLDLALRVFPETHPTVGAIYNNIGEVYSENGDYNQALIYIQKAASIFETGVGKKDTRVASCYANIGVIQIIIGDFPDALKSLRDALSILSGIPGQGSMIASIFNSMGRIYREKNNSDSAEYYFRKAITIFLNEAPENPDLAVCYSNLGELYSKSGKIDRALVNYQKALTINQEIFGNKHPNAAILFYNIGDMYFDLGKYSQAIKYMQKSMIANIQDFTDSLITHNPGIENSFSRLYLLGALEAKAAAFYQLYEIQPNSIGLLKTALSTVDLAIQLLDELRINFKAEDAKAFMNKRYLEAYPSGVCFCYLLYHKTGDPKYLEKAFTYSEKSRSAVLYSSLKELEARSIGGIPDSIQNLEKNLRLDLAFYTKSIQEEQARKNSDQKKVKLWQNLQFTMNHSYDSLIRSFEQSYPEYYQLKYDLKIAGIKEIQSQLSDKDVIIEYALADKMLFTFILSPCSVSFIGTAINSTFYKNIDTFRNMILHKEFSGGAATSFSKVANSLYETLVKRVEPLLKNKNLIIIPDGKLGTIPFEALITEAGNATANNYKSLRYLIKNHAIGYGYSATIYLQSLKMKNRSPKTDILAFAPSFKTGNPVLLAELKERGEEFVSLTGSKDEVKNIQQLYGGKVFLDTTATKANFLQFSSQYSILHISTHGIMNDEKPMQSKLVFYQKNDSTDANLFAYEIFNMKLKADLVVLSACNTGFGKLEAGEGIMSLARGFLYAGVPSIVSTLWSVNDQSTADIMKDFYKYLNKKDEKPVALQKAQIDYLDGADNITAHPFYWSGFVSIGNNQPVCFTNPFIKWGILAITLFAMIYTLLWVKRKRKVKTE